jgi:hypothetical protein
MKHLTHFFWQYMVVVTIMLLLPAGTFAAGSGLGSPGNMLEFDGSNYADYTSNFDPSSSFTIEGWFNADLTGPFVNRGFLVFSENGPGLDFIALSTPNSNPGALQFTIANNAAADIITTANGLILSGECNHVAVVVDGTLDKLTLYLNGVQVSQINLVNVPDPTVLANLTENFIGGNYLQGYNALTNGSVDELRIWDVARTPAQILAGYNTDMLPLPADLEDYYNFDVSHPQVSILDIGAGPANNLSLIGAPVPDLVQSCADVYTDVPGAFALVSPANNAIDVDACSGCVDFTWDPASNGQTYTLRVYSDLALTQQVGITVTNHPTTTASICGLSANTQYWWTVVATNPLGTTNGTPTPATFTTAPNMPELYTPLNGAIGQVTNPHLTWEDLTATLSCDSIVFTVYVDNNDDFSSPEFTFTTTAATQYLGGLDMAETYYWYVEAEIFCPDPLNPYVRCSEVFSFKTGVGWNNVAAFAVGQIVWDIVSCGDYLYAGTWGGGIYRSHIPTDPMHEYWVRVDPPAGDPGSLESAFIWDLAIEEPINCGLYAATEQGLFYSSNDGEFWTRETALDAAIGTEPDVRQVVSCDIPFGNVVVGTWGYGVWYFDISGPAWFDGNQGLPPNAAIEGLAYNETCDTLYVGLADGGIYKRAVADLGSLVIDKRWKKLNNMPYRFIWALETGPTPYVFAGTYGDGFWRSTTSGYLWTQENFGLNNNYVHALFFSDDGGSNQLYAGTWPGGVYRADDYTLTTPHWEDLGLTQFVNSDASGVNVSCIYEIGGTLFVGTSDGRIYASNGDGPTSVGDEEVLNNVIPENFVVEQNYPNPFNPSTTIKFGIPEAGLVSVKIYDMLGQEIRTLVDGMKNAGTFAVTWNGDNDFGQKVSSGTYIYRVTVGANIITKKMVLLK